MSSNLKVSTKSSEKKVSSISALSEPKAVNNNNNNINNNNNNNDNDNDDNNNNKSNITKLSEEDLAELKTAFCLLDKNNDGRLTVSEFQHMLKNFGIFVPDMFILALIKQASKTGAGILNETEFTDWISSFLNETPNDLSQDLKAAFKLFDSDNNGYLTTEELKAGMELIGETVTDEDLNEMIKLADVDKDGRIDYEEFARLLS